MWLKGLIRPRSVGVCAFADFLSDHHEFGIGGEHPAESFAALGLAPCQRLPWRA